MEHVLSALTEIFTLFNLSVIAVSLLLGVIVGCIPGLTVSLGIILLIPLTFYFPSASSAIIALLSIYVGGMYGGSISSILLNTPGTNAAIVTAFDGHPLAKRGKAKKALDVSLFASVVGGTISAFLLLFLSGPFSRLAANFTSTEFFSLGILGISLVAGVSGDSIFKGIIAGLMGIFISLIGLDIVSGVSRFTFDSMLLYQGISIMPAMIALIALTQIVIKSREHIISNKESSDILKIDKEGMSKSERKAIMPVILRSTLIASVIGVIPAIGACVGQFICYNEAKRVSKKPEEFGKGSLEGIASVEACNNAVVGTATIPLLTMGIPGDGVTALLLGAFVLHGIIPGPAMFTQHADTAYKIIVGVIVANFLLYFIGVAFTRQVAKIVQVRYTYIGPLITAFCFAGAFAVNASINEVIVMMFLLILSYVLMKLDISVIPIMLGMILAPILERNFINSMLIYDGDLLIFFKRPMSLFILLLTVFLVWSSIRVNKKNCTVNLEQD
jgi:putative tricarboxylic transport membrane protein